MSYQISLRLSDDEYAMLAAEAAKSGTTIEAVAHERLIQRPTGQHTTDRLAIQEHVYGQGIVENLPTGGADTPEEEAEAERLARLFGGGKSAAAMVIEDRGPF